MCFLTIPHAILYKCFVFLKIGDLYSHSLSGLYPVRTFSCLLQLLFFTIRSMFHMASIGIGSEQSEGLCYPYSVSNSGGHHNFQKKV